MIRKKTNHIKGNHRNQITTEMHQTLFENSKRSLFVRHSLDI